MFNKKEPKDMSFILTRKSSPLSYMLNSRNTRSNPLQYWDNDKKINRILRYAVNQKSPFEDEQDGHAIIEPIIFDDGSLFVPKTNPVLQEFLLLHPQYNKSFKLMDRAVDAQTELEEMDASDEAASLARKLSIEQMESIAIVQLNLKVDKMTTPEIKRDVIRFAKNNPHKFMGLIDNPDLDLSGMVSKCFTSGLLKTRSNDSQIWYNLSENKTKLIDVPHGNDYRTELVNFLKTNDGIKVMQMLEKELAEA